VATHIDIDELAATAEDLGMGSVTGVDLIGESPGLIPNRAWKRKRYNEPWYPGETSSVAIGQGAILATPLQLVTLMSTIATDGQIPTPHFMAKIGGDGADRAYQPARRLVEGIEPELFHTLQEAMWAVVNDPHGTGKAAKVEGFDVCGKTGTAQLINFTTEEDHENTDFLNAWFAGFAPRFEPRIAVIVLVEQAGAGGLRAAPIAKELFEAYRRAPVKVDPT
jgi:penicillin-binding protein 2